MALLLWLLRAGVGLVCAIVTRTATYAVILLTFVMLMVLSFSGFLVGKVRPTSRCLTRWCVEECWARGLHVAVALAEAPKPS